MRTLPRLLRPFGRSIGHRIVMQLIAIGCLFLLICLHLQYEFANRASSTPSSKTSRRSSSRRKYDKRFPTDDDFAWYAGTNDGSRINVGRTKINDDDDMELLYIDINDEQRNPARAERGADQALAPGDGALEGGGNRGSGGNLAGMGQYPVGRKALLSKRISSVGDEYPAAIESDERSFAGLPLQPWANRDHSMDSEARRFFKYITTKQVQCREQQAIGSNKPAGTGSDWAWMVCFDEASSYVSRGALRPGCVVYSFGARTSNIRFETEMAERGCMVHIFDPSGRVKEYVASSSKGQRSSQQHGGNGKSGNTPKNLVFHKTTLDWRDTNLDSRDKLSWRPSKLSAIMSRLGHDTIDIVRADLQSAEWKVLENLLVDGTVSRIHQLLFNVHLNWSGFEVQGSNDDVIRFWYSVLKQLQVAHFKLFHSWEDKAEPPIFLGQTMPDISSTYTLGWVNSAWR